MGRSIPKHRWASRWRCSNTCRRRTSARGPTSSSGRRRTRNTARPAHRRMRPGCARQPFAVSQLVVAEPTHCVPVYRHRGVARFELTFHGVPAHSSQPDLGRNALVAAASTVLAYADEHQRLQDCAARSHRSRQPDQHRHPRRHRHQRRARPVARCLVDRRVVDGEDPATIIDALHTLAQTPRRFARRLPPSPRRSAPSFDRRTRR